MTKLLFDIPCRNKKEHDSRVSQFINIWRTLWYRKYRTNWIDGAPAKHYAIVKRLLIQLDNHYDKHTSLRTLEIAAQNLLAGKIKWIKGKPSIGLLSTFINELSENKHNVKRKQPDWDKIEQQAAANRK